MKISLLNERILIEKSKVRPDSIGNRKNIWIPYFSCWATISSESPMEQTSSGVVWDESKIDFSIRYCRELSKLTSTGFRVLFHDCIYEILGIDHMNYKKKSIKLHCRRVER